MITLTGYAGWFTRQGQIIGEYNRVAAQYGSALDEGFQSIWVQFASSQQAAIAPLPAAYSAYAQTGSSYEASLVSVGQATALSQAVEDTVVVPATFVESINVLYYQMVNALQSINRPTLAASTVPTVTNLGEVTIAVGFGNQYGDQLDMCFGETIEVAVTAATSAYQETFTFIGQDAVAAGSPLWPAGSGANKTFQAYDPIQNGIITNGSWDNWTGTGNNTPVGWTILDGASGVTVFRGTGGVRGSYYANLTSDGSSPTQLGQSVSLSTNTYYCMTVQAKVSASDPTGTMIMSITDADGNILDDDRGTPLSFIADTNTEVTTSWQNFTFFFSTPRQLPLTVFAQFGFGTAPAAAVELNLDLGGIIAPQQLYTGGEYIQVISGALRNAVGDSYVTTVTTTLGSKSFARGLDRLYNFRQNQVYLPSSNSPTISDSLVSH